MSLISLSSRSRFLNSSLRRLTRTTFVLRAATVSALYHSYDHPSPPPYPPAETSILSAALSHIPTHGFSDTSLVLGARDAGYLPVSVNLLPRGVFELVMFWLVSRRLGLKEALDGNDGGLRRQWEEHKLGVGGRVRSLVLERLRMNERADTVGKWQEALAIMAQPAYVPASLKELANLADEIWFLAGDTSVDTSWYTKRASLAAIYAAAEVFQTQDKSPGFTDTERFLDERLRDLRMVGTAMSEAGEWIGFTGHSLINVLRSKGVRL